MFIVTAQDGQPMAAFTTLAAAALFRSTAPGTFGASVHRVAVDIGPNAHTNAQRIDARTLRDACQR